MATLATLEQQIVAEYGVLIGFIKNNSVLSTAAALALGWAVGHYL